MAKKKNKGKKQNYFKKIRKELSLVKWPKGKEVLKYSLATIMMCLGLCAFFLVLNLLLSLLKGLFI
ncbi:MAG: preprotein translocase subunit SecE [Firmicutes bacterium]|nr:preprotein translocase subunit SecE [Bacillota bacterium]